MRRATIWQCGNPNRIPKISENVKKKITEIGLIVFDMKTSAPGLTPGELKVVLQLSFGQSNRAIATALGISIETVKRHLATIFDKTGTKSRLQLMLWAQETDIWK